MIHLDQGFGISVAEVCLNDPELNLGALVSFRSRTPNFRLICFTKYRRRQSWHCECFPAIAKAASCGVALLRTRGAQLHRRALDFVP
jgi:hypothetical protein